MQFLLVAVNAKYIHSNPAIYSLRAYAGEEYKPFIRLAEYTINNQKEEILADLYRRNPSVIGFSCYIWNIDMILNLLVELPKILPNTHIWLGGPEVSFNGQELLAKYPGVKGIMTGEGEETFKELLQYYLVLQEQKQQEEDSSLEQIKGLILRSGITPPRELTEIDKLLFLYENPEEFKNKIIYYESARGCPFQCSYCLSAIDKSVRLRNLAMVKKELQVFLEHKVPQVKFVDRTFNCNHLHATEIWKYIKEHDNGVTNFHFEIAADIITEEEIELLSGMRAGLVQLEIGVQSTNEQTLHAINRFVNTRHIAEVVERLQKNQNIHIHLDLIAGLPFEDYNSFVNSFDEVYGMEPQQLQLGFLKVLKGSPIALQAAEYEIIYGSKAPYEVLCTKWISYGQLLQLKQVEKMVEIYYNSNQYRHILPVLLESFSSPFAMFEALAHYYEEKGYFLNTPSRDYRYQVLLEFAVGNSKEKEELYKELLIYDFYSRENAKSRPSYGKDLSAYKEEIRKYQEKQIIKMTHVEAFFYPVWEKQLSEVKKKKVEPMFVLFDYRHRSPLTHDAEIIVFEK